MINEYDTQHKVKNTFMAFVLLLAALIPGLGVIFSGLKVFAADTLITTSEERAQVALDVTREDSSSTNYPRPPIGLNQGILKVDGKVAFCLEPGVAAMPVKETKEEYDPSDYQSREVATLTAGDPVSRSTEWQTVIQGWNNPPSQVQRANQKITEDTIIAIALAEDYLGQNPSAAKYTGVQVYVWKTIEGNGVNGYTDTQTNNAGTTTFVTEQGVKDAHNEMDRMVKAFKNGETAPQFDTNSGSVKAGESITFTVSNDVSLDGYGAVNNHGADIQMSDNTITITPSRETPEDARFRFVHGDPDGEAYLTAYGHREFQNLATTAEAHLPNFPFNLSLTVDQEQPGEARIVKQTDQDLPSNGNYSLAGNEFTISGTANNGTEVNETLTTNENGETETITIPAGTYNVVETNVSSGLIKGPESDGTISVEEEQTATFTSTNVIQGGRIRVDKSGEKFGKDMPTNYSLADNEFTITGEDGTQVVITTDENGQAETEWLPLQTYTVEETATNPTMDNTFETQTVTLSGDNQEAVIVRDVAGTNREKGVELNIDKSGEQFGKDMFNENYSLAGIEFTITGEDGSVYTATTDDNGQATVEADFLPIQNYHVEETHVPDGNGYLLTFTPQTAVFTDGGQVMDFEYTVSGTNQEIGGKIMIDKSGEHSGKDMWTDRYTLAGNEFSIVGEDGVEYDRITTDTNGYAETTAFLPLQTYTVEEVKASPGFTRTFETQTVSITQEGQTAIVERDVSGTNDEVTGQVTLSKVDSETGKTPQGKASLVGAEYTLYDEHGTPVRWDFGKGIELSDNAEKVSEDEVVVRITDDENVDFTLSELPLGNYSIKETKAPEGYQIDPNRYDFSVDYVDDTAENNVVVVDTVESPENVIKFNMNGLKELLTETASSGGQNVTLKLTPLENTRGSGLEFGTPEYETTTSRVTQGLFTLDGYWEFTDIPYGDYRLEEVEAPEGYQLIEPLNIESSYNEESGTYSFIVSNDRGTVLQNTTATVEEINAGSNIVTMASMTLKDGELIVIDDLPEIETDFVSSEGSQEIDANQDQTLIDHVYASIPKEDVAQYNTFYFDTQFHKVYTNEDGDQVSEVVGEVEVPIDFSEVDMSQVEETETHYNYHFEVPFEYTAGTIGEGEKLVATHMVYVSPADERTEDEAPYAEHYDLDNERQTIRGRDFEEPTVETDFIAEDGSQTIDVNEDQILTDIVSGTVPESDVGKELFFDTQFYRIPAGNEGKSHEELMEVAEVVGEVVVPYTPEATEYSLEVPFEYEAGMIEAGDRLVATHRVYTSEDMSEEDHYADHFDLTNERQTIHGVGEDPTIETLFITEDGEKEFFYNEDQVLIDIVRGTIPESRVGETFNYATEFHRIPADATGTTHDELMEVAEVVGEVSFDYTPESAAYEFEVPFEYKADILQPGDRLVATHIMREYDENGELIEEPYVTHYDLTNTDQTLTAVDKPETPEREGQETGIGKQDRNIAPIATAVGIPVVALAGYAFYKKKVK